MHLWRKKTNYRINTTSPTPQTRLETQPEHNILIISNQKLYQKISQKLPPKYNIRHTTNGLLALGDLAHHPATNIIAQVDLFENNHALLSTLKQIAPNAKIRFINNNSEPTPQSLNTLLNQPIDASDLLKKFTSPQTKAPSDNHIASQAKPAIAPPQSLGDTDQITDILSANKNLIQSSLQIITQQSNIKDLSFLPITQTPDENQIAIPVTHNNKTLGHITHNTPKTNTDILNKLAPYATWLSHWITLENKIQELKLLAYKDELTGAWNRRYFYNFLNSILKNAADHRFQVTVMVYDIDDFKKYNDKYGHAAGDQILTQTVKLMQSVVRKRDIVARIGGDEFAVIFWDAKTPRKQNSKHPSSVKTAAERFQKAICSHKFPKLLQEAPGTLTISGGLASFPWDGTTAEILVSKADDMAIQSKNLGKNAITFGPGAQRSCNISTQPKQ